MPHLATLGKVKLYFFPIIFTLVSIPCPLFQNTSIHHIGRLCELNCGYFSFAQIQNAFSDHRHLDTMFKTFNFQFKTGQHFDHCRWKDAVFSQTNEIIHLKQGRLFYHFCWKYIQFSALFCLLADLLPTMQKWCSTAFALKCACLKGKYRFSCR